MASTAKSKLTTSTKRRKSLHQRRCRRRHRKYIESLELSKSSTSSDQIFYPPKSWYPPMSSESPEDSERWEPPELPSPPEWMTIPVPEEPDLSPDSPTPLSYGNVRCKRCRQLAELKLQSKPDDDEYVCPDDDFYDDEELRLRVIHYRRTLDLNGVCFDVDCFPNYQSYGGVYHKDHYYLFPNFDKMIWKSLKFAINTYCEKEKKELVLLGLLNATAQVVGRWILFYLTFECYNPNAEENNYVDILQTLVNCPVAHKAKQQVYVFRRVTNDEQDEDLLPPHELRVQCTLAKTPRRFDTLRAKFPTSLWLDI
ncbi:hypothetical protein LINPERPRIM_LOCUS4264 [Linum perenne]